MWAQVLRVDLHRDRWTDSLSCSGASSITSRPSLRFSEHNLAGYKLFQLLLKLFTHLVFRVGWRLFFLDYSMLRLFLAIVMLWEVSWWLDFSFCRDFPSLYFKSTCRGPSELIWYHHEAWLADSSQNLGSVWVAKVFCCISWLGHLAEAHTLQNSSLILGHHVVDMKTSFLNLASYIIHCTLLFILFLLLTVPPLVVEIIVDGVDVA